MAEQSFQERTEPATPKRRHELRRQGRVAKSVELSTAAVLLAGTAGIYLFGGQSIRQIAAVMKDFLSLSYGLDLNQNNIMSLIRIFAFRMILIIAPVILTIMLVGVGSNLAQFGFLFTLKAFKPRGINPLKGLKRLGFSQHSLVELTKSFLKIALVGWIGYVSVKSFLANSVTLVDSSPFEIFSYMGSSAFAIAMKVSAAFVILAGTDYYFQRQKFEHDIRMTKQEVKEEQKQEEGNPTIKGRIRREMVKRHRLRMMQAVPKADVVVTNPTHYAIAIKYDVKTMTAPKVVAKGKDLIAQKIKEIAIEHNVPIVEDKPLALLLYKTVEIDEQIPPDLFKAVAQILAYIYQMKKMKHGFGRR